MGKFIYSFWREKMDCDDSKKQEPTLAKAKIIIQQKLSKQ